MDLSQLHSESCLRNMNRYHIPSVQFTGLEEQEMFSVGKNIFPEMCYQLIMQQVVTGCPL